MTDHYILGFGKVWRKNLWGQHLSKNPLYSHGMAACSPTREKIAGTMPFLIFVAKDIVIMLASKTCGKLGEGDAVFLLGITLGFLNLTN